jgi:hypothetical protein
MSGHDQRWSVVRRIGVPPRERGSSTDISCPDILELDDGQFLVIGSDVTDIARDRLPSDAAIAPYERAVLVTRATLVRAKADIPDR